MTSFEDSPSRAGREAGRGDLPGTAKVWLLGSAIALGAAYILMVMATASARGWFEYLALDFRVYYSVGQLALADGFGEIYDLGRLEPLQQALYEHYAAANENVMRFSVMPMPYLPVFAIPFPLFSLLPPLTSFVLWDLGQLGLLALCWVRIRRHLGLKPDAWVLLAWLSLPGFLTLLFGQVNGWLCLCLGECLIARRTGRHATSGMWLAGSFLKPQLMILFIFGMMLGRKSRLLLGLFSGIAALLAASVGLSGLEGLRQLLDVILNYKSSYGDFPKGMQNWRMLATHLMESGMVHGIAWSIAGVGMATTALASLSLWWKRRSAVPDRFEWVVLGTLAGTCAVTWHSQVHMSLPIVVPLLMLLLLGRVSGWVVGSWVLGPPVAFLGVYAAAGSDAAHSAGGLAMLIVNLALVGLSFAQIHFGIGGTGTTDSGQSA